MNYSIYKKYIAFLLSLNFFLSACDTSKNTVSLDQLKGYWEIHFIKQQGEVFKIKSVTPLYDHYSLDENIGILNKVAPSMMGTFLTSADATSFVIKTRKENFYLKFKTPWDEWSKKIIFLDSQKLILENEERTFHYKRPSLINLNNE
ncbi:MAG: hypothetical protein ACI9TK_000299 [Flavobacteriaceae bacterium]|jgi:hypothetical protein|tara:strand:- start:5336 stop:5776 length:441 start_codon:yes stop_codon:yes gene_type:complete